MIDVQQFPNFEDVTKANAQLIADHMADILSVLDNQEIGTEDKREIFYKLGHGQDN